MFSFIGLNVLKYKTKNSKLLGLIVEDRRNLHKELEARSLQRHPVSHQIPESQNDYYVVALKTSLTRCNCVSLCLHKLCLRARTLRVSFVHTRKLNPVATQ
jgi:hypothetical protein